MTKPRTPAPEAPADADVTDAPAEDEVVEVETVDVKAILAAHVDAVKAVRTAEATAQSAREALASVIRSAREAKGETRPPVAKRAGITIAQLAGIELGRAATRDELAALGTALEIEELANLA